MFRMWPRTSVPDMHSSLILSPISMKIKITTDMFLIAQTKAVGEKKSLTVASYFFLHLSTHSSFFLVPEFQRFIKEALLCCYSSFFVFNMIDLISILVIRHRGNCRIEGNLIFKIWFSSEARQSILYKNKIIHK